MTYTQAQIDKANAVDLEKFLRTQGETLVRSGKEYRWKAHDSLTVCRATTADRHQKNRSFQSLYHRAMTHRERPLQFHPE